MFHLLESEVPTWIIWNSSAWEICFSPPFVCWFDHLCISVWTHSYLFYSLSYDPIPVCFFCCSNCLTIRSSFRWLMCPSDISPINVNFCCSCCFWKLPYVLVLQDALSLFCIFPAPGLAFPPRIPGSFYWRMVLGAKIWVLVCSLLFRSHLF